jgi:arylsulfatase A-like enzyme
MTAGTVTLVVALALGAAPAQAGRVSGARTTGPPNIVVILTDDQRWDTLGYMPNVQSMLVDKGVTFTNTFASNSLCCPSRTSMLTGNYSHTTGIYKNGPPFGGFPSFDDKSTIATWLNHSYDTALIGKYLNSYEGGAARGYIPPGWNHWSAFADAAYYHYTLNTDGIDQQYGNRPQDYSTTVLGNQAVSFINSGHSGNPFFLWFAPYGPHEPAIPADRDKKLFPDLAPWRPASFNEPDASDKPGWVQSAPLLGAAQVRRLDALRRRQLQTLQEEDRVVGNIVNALAQNNQLDNTMIVFASDNGVMWGEHRMLQKGMGYDEAQRIPLVIRYDPVTQYTQRVESQLTANIDFAPTFADVAGVNAPAAEGQSLMPLLEDTPEPWRTSLLFEHLIVPNDSPRVPTFCGIRTEQWAYFRYQAGGDELYDLATDPLELTNLANDPAYAETRDSLRLSLAQLCSPPPPGFTLPVP